MDQQPTRAVDIFTDLLQEWVETACPAPQRDIPALNAIWGMLAEELCGSQKAKLAVFRSELAELRRGPSAGDPPVKAIRQRLRELTAVGLREFFLVVAARQAMDHLIAVHVPSAQPLWTQLADRSLPLRLQFAEQHEERRGPRATYIHGSDS